MNKPWRWNSRISRTLYLTAPIALVCTSLGSCRSVKYFEKGAFADPTMEFAESPAQLHWQQKVQYSDEGAAGGIGTSAGGGCGCY